MSYRRPSMPLLVPSTRTSSASSTERILFSYKNKPDLSDEERRLAYLRRRLHLPQVSFLPPEEKMPDSYDIVPVLGGRSNHTYKITVNNKNYAVRLSGKNYKAVVNIEAEQGMVELASRLGICPRVLFFDSGNRMQISEFLEEDKSLNAEAFANLDNIKTVVGLIKQLHQADKDDLQAAIDVFTIDRNFLEMIDEEDVDLPDTYATLLMQADQIEALLALVPATKVPCHNDLQPSNVLLSNNKLYLNDLERGGLNDPVYDLAKFSIEACLSDEQEEYLLKLYYDSEQLDKTAESYRRLQVYKAVVLSNVALWCRTILITEQDLTDAESADYTNYEKTQLNRYQAFVKTEAYSKAIEYYSQLQKDKQSTQEKDPDSGAQFALEQTMG